MEKLPNYTNLKCGKDYKASADPQHLFSNVPSNVWQLYTMINWNIHFRETKKQNPNMARFER